uniref:Uncharacterized protein n=1 Tax=Cyprinus carpio carpio TaxID=630221 RepID=A0A9J7ZS93_CYPCA
MYSAHLIAQTTEELVRHLELSCRVAKRESDRRRAKSRVNIGAAFDSWRELRSALDIVTGHLQYIISFIVRASD